LISWYLQTMLLNSFKGGDMVNGMDSSFKESFKRSEEDPFKTAGVFWTYLTWSSCS
jgi:hypothetical protein